MNDLEKLMFAIGLAAGLKLRLSVEKYECVEAVEIILEILVKIYLDKGGSEQILRDYGVIPK